jgi:hypothetical protein
MSRLDRFKRLEAKRADRAGEGPKQTEARFNRVEKERAPGEAPPPRAAPERIERQVGEQPLTLDTRSTEEQQFTRCMHCEADNSRFAQTCIHCGAPLQTEPQRDYNERFWRQRQEQTAREQQGIQQLRQGKAQLTDEQARVQRAAFEQMVQEAQSDARNAGQPWGIRMINALKDPIQQWLLIGFFAAVAVGSVAGLRYARPDQPSLRWVCGGALLALVVLFTPPSWWTQRSRRGRGWFFGDDDWL